MSEVVGREQELGSVYAFLDRPVAGPAGFVLEGEPGIGKSTLWLAAVAAAREQGLLVLSSRPAEAERRLPHVGLADLFDDVLEEVLPALPTPRRRALEVALLVEGPAGGKADPRALGMGVRTALQLLAANRRVLVAIDDVQWLDAGSAGALAFALRRLDDANVLLLLARRTGGKRSPAPLENVLSDRAVQRLALGPLSVGALHGLLQQRLGRTFARPTLLRLHETAGGNPFYALELARSLERAAAVILVPETLADLVRRRLAALSEETRAALLAVAALGRPSRTAAAAAGITEGELAPALAADVIEVVGDEIRFTHPLLSSTVYGDAAPDERRELHRRLASVVDEPVSRARHLALGHDLPDKAIAQSLEEAATLARARGAVAAAAELGELAAQMTPSERGDDERRRFLAAARDHVASGATDRALALAQDALERAASPLARAEALALLSEIHARAGGAGGARAAVAYGREALAQRSGRPEVELLVHEVLSSSLLQTEGATAAETHALAAVELAEALGKPTLVARAVAQLADARLAAGEKGALALAARAVAEAQSVREPATIIFATQVHGAALLSLGRLDEAREVLQESYRWAAAHDESEIVSLCALFATLELRTGRWAHARDYAQRMRDLASQIHPAGHEAERGFGMLALVSTHRGDEPRARAYAAQALANVEGGGWSAGVRSVRSTLGLLESWAGKPLAAVEHFAAVEAELRAAGLRGPSLGYRPGEHVEALLELGEIDAAVEVLERWEADAARVDNAWELAEAMRSRGLVAAARGDLDEAHAALEAAVAKHEETGDPLGRARALLALGLVSRRKRQKRAARQAIDEALAGFEALGARGWAAKARRELGRIGGRTRTEGLTPAELRVAALVAEGRTNREVAAALVLGERTVETHLSHIYAKLGVRSRAELARTFHA
jgi:DNA-binding NarL/FixJ family response regulator